MIQMNWKSMLAVFSVIGIGLILLGSEGGRDFADKSLYSFKVGIGDAVSGAFSSGGMFGPKMPSGDGFVV